MQNTGEDKETRRRCVDSDGEALRIFILDRLEQNKKYNGMLVFDFDYTMADLRGLSASQLLHIHCLADTHKPRDTDSLKYKQLRERVHKSGLDACCFYGDKDAMVELLGIAQQNNVAVGIATFTGFLRSLPVILNYWFGEDIASRISIVGVNNQNSFFDNDVESSGSVKWRAGDIYNVSGDKLYDKSALVEQLKSLYKIDKKENILMYDDNQEVLNSVKELAQTQIVYDGGLTKDLLNRAFELCSSVESKRKSVDVPALMMPADKPNTIVSDCMLGVVNVNSKDTKVS